MPIAAVAQGREQLLERVDARRQRWPLAADQRRVDADRNVPPQDLEGCLGAHRQRARAFERTLDLDLDDVARALADLHAGHELSQEVEGAQRDQHVEAGIAGDVEAHRPFGIQVRRGAELHAVGGQCEVGLAGQARVAAGGQVQRQAFERWKTRRRRERAVHAADGQREAARRGPAHAQRHRPGEHELVEQFRVDQHGVDGHRALVEIDDAEHIHAQHEQAVVGVGQDRADAAEDDEAVAHAPLDQQPQVHRDDGRHAPGDAQHRPEDVAAVLRREDAFEGGEDVRCVLHRVLREQDQIERLRAQAFAQRLFAAGAVDRQQAADAGQRKAHRQADRLKALGGDDQHHRIALVAAGHARGDEADRLQRHQARDFEFEHAAVLMLDRVVEDEAAALDRLGVDADADGARRQPTEIHVREVEVARCRCRRPGQPRAQAHMIDARKHRADVRADRDRDADIGMRLGTGGFARQAQDQLVEPDRTQTLAEVDAPLQAARARLAAGQQGQRFFRLGRLGGLGRLVVDLLALEVLELAAPLPPAARHVALADVELDLGLAVGQQRADEAVDLAGVEGQRTVA